MRSEEMQQVYADYFLRLAHHAEALFLGYNEGGVITYVAPNAERVLRWSAVELEGRHLSDLVHAEDMEALHALLEVGQDGMTRAVELRMKTATGRWRWLRGASCEVGKEGEVTRRIAMLQDATEQKALEARLVTSGRAAAVGALAAGIAHEVSNPLSFIQGNLEYLVSALPKASEAEAKALVEEILPDMLAGARRIGEVMRGLRTLTAAASPRDRMVDLRQLLELTVRMLQHTRKGHLPIVAELEDVPLLQADEGLLVQVVVSLLDNAIESLKRSTRELPLIYLRLRMEGERVLVEVEDQGAGLGEVSSTQTSVESMSQGAGLGLGLAISRYVVSQLKGELEVDGVVGEWMRARIWLPLRQPVRQQMETPPQQEARVQAKRVLVVDGEAAIGRMLPRLLKAPWEVRWCRSAEEAVVLLETGVEVDVILCELSLPGMSGERFEEVVRTRWPALEGRMGFLRGGGPTRCHEPFMQRIQARMLAKPFEREALLDLLSRLSG
jgi:PAS domain S-box-containing protein